MDTNAYIVHVWEYLFVRMCVYVETIHTYILVSWCGGELWVDQRKKCTDICDVAQVTDIRTLPN